MGTHWDVELYEARHSFVWKMGSSLIELLQARPGERIADLGCGTGQLTAEIQSQGAAVIGIDNSPAMIAQARINFPHIDFRLADAAQFRVEPPVDAVFSNAALHWLKDAESAVACIASALKPGGRLVAEFGGKGNVAAILSGVTAVVGPVETPWYFPSIAEYATLLERNGMEVTFAQLYDRPTPLEGESGLVDWLEMFGDALFGQVPAPQRRNIRNSVAEQLRPQLYRDGTWYADYRRLRITAVRLS